MIGLAVDEYGRIDLAYDGGLCDVQEVGTAVLLSLFSDGRVPDGSSPGDKRGWMFEVGYGSRLWLALRSSLTVDVLAQIKKSADDALAWMIRDGVAREITVVVTRQSRSVVRLAVELRRADGGVWESAWDVTSSGENICAV